MAINAQKKKGNIVVLSLQLMFLSLLFSQSYFLTRAENLEALGDALGNPQPFCCEKAHKFESKPCSVLIAKLGEPDKKDESGKADYEHWVYKKEKLEFWVDPKTGIVKAAIDTINVHQ